ncbi:MAG: hypothetical protein MJ252_21635, partial [archaeon]|nr:hypothetical protein [archaeon]
MEITFLFILFSLSICQTEKFISIPFKLEFYDPIYSMTETEEEKVFKKLNFFSTTIELYLGTKPQKIKVNLSTSRYYFYFISAKLNNDKVFGFNETASESFHKVDYQPILRSEDGEEYIEFRDWIKISENEKNASNYFVALITKFKDDTIENQRNGGVIGFDLEPRRFTNAYNFISAVKGRNLINQYDVFLNYTSDFEGNLLIGLYPWNLSNYRESDFIKSKAEIINDEVHWSIIIQSISIGNKQMDFFENPFYSLISFEDYMFTSPFSFLKEFKEKYFKKYFEKKICSELNYGEYIYIYCNQNGFDYSG